ncbi:D-alanyl-D-alanine carboxypeptidase family protein [Candidatus Woesearchaeota archaeon]|nr:D-alanyl-D-alanine carboxypeptidase family protein [Candidatus Woesearchaeota archaeon]
MNHKIIFIIIFIIIFSSVVYAVEETETNECDGFWGSLKCLFVRDTQNIAGEASMVDPVVASSGNCNNLKISIIGASNTVKSSLRKSFGEFIKDSCPGSTVNIYAEGSCGAQCQNSKYIQPALSSTPDLLIINPSGNIGSSSTYRASVVLMAEEAKKKNPNIKVGIIAISPHKNYDYGGSAKWTQSYQDKLEEFNKDLIDSKLGFPSLIDYEFNIYPLLGSSSDKDVCGYCRSDRGHWLETGQKIVADYIVSVISGKITPSAPPHSGAQKGPPPQAAVAGNTFSSATFQGTDSEREIDEVWNRISSFVGIHSGDVWYQNTWQPYVKVYGSGIPSGTTTTPTLGGGDFSCNGGDFSKLPSSSLSKCNNYLDLYQKHAKALLGTDDTNTILLLMALTQQESGCSTTVNGGLMQVDAVCRPVSNCPTADKQIEEGIKVYKSSSDGLSTTTGSDRINLILFSYNRGLATAKKALTYKNQGSNLHDSMLKACRDIFNKECRGTEAKCKYDTHGNDKCDFPGYGAQYPTKVQSRFNKACSDIGGTIGTGVSSSSSTLGAPQRICNTVSECLPICNDESSWSTRTGTNILPVNQAVQVQSSEGIVVIGSPDQGLGNKLGLSGVVPTFVHPYLIIPLKNAGVIAASKGYEIHVSGGLRSLEHQLTLACPSIKDGTFNSATIAYPGGSNHGSGHAVDIILFNQGVQMSAPFRSSIQSNSEYTIGNEELAKIMYQAGWKRLKSEAWHFEYPNLPLEPTRTTTCTTTPPCANNPSPLVAQTSPSAQPSPAQVGNINTGLSSTTALNKWNKALSDVGITGQSFVGKFQSNGPTDSYKREDTGRDTLIFVPSTTDLTQPYEIMYYFHGISGFDVDMRQRLTPQSKRLMDRGVNFVLAFPELPWSEGTGGDRHKNRQLSYLDSQKDLDFFKLHENIKIVLQNQFGATSFNVKTSLLGHSAGGAALSYLANNGYLSMTKPYKVVLSDADYSHWDTTQVVWDKYVQLNPAVEYDIFIKKPGVSDGGSTTPTKNTIKFLKKINPLIDTSQRQKVGNQINYYPLTLSDSEISPWVNDPTTPSSEPLHHAIGRTTLAWDTTSIANT